MKFRSVALLAASLVFSAATAHIPAHAQGMMQPALKPATPGAIAAAKEILTLKNAAAMYAGAVPNVVQRTRDTLTQSNLNYQKDLDEVAQVVAKQMAGKEKEITERMALIYANDFTEQELKDLVTFYNSPLGKKLLAQEPQSIAASMNFMQQWGSQFGEQVNGAFRAEMRKRGKEI